jgi:hypothetical protein
MLKNSLTASVLLFIGLLSVPLAATATPPEPMPNKPPLALMS